MTVAGHAPGGDSTTWQAVHRALCDYLDAVDGGDFDRLAELMEHATVILPSGRITGGPAIREVYERIQPVPDEDGRRRTKHHLTNLVVSEPGEDGSVVADAYYLVLESGPDGPRVQKTGRFRDWLTSQQDGWVIQEHRVLLDF
ncbi:hypothetical protein FNH13_14230 [Ornithinimicrobium ciconiae]|uniref:SnoaL-like domain-containing protein n=1 Tax=Ornithinimicrobium ciconiae TaxID=2594265 RepID=A0A516GCU4_9MICO|nr:hypothetical protein FNH13_14230 [Ornithinimicrobium ciconiae]